MEGIIGVPVVGVVLGSWRFGFLLASGVGGLGRRGNKSSSLGGWFIAVYTLSFWVILYDGYEKGKRWISRDKWFAFSLGSVEN